MQKPDFGKLKGMLRTLEEAYRQFEDVFVAEDAQQGKIVALSGRIRMESAGDRFAEVPTESLRESGLGAATDLLISAGYTDLGKLARAADYELLSIDGIGEKRLAMIREALSQMMRNLAQFETLRLLSPEELTGAGPESGQQANLTGAGPESGQQGNLTGSSPERARHQEQQRDLQKSLIRELAVYRRLEIVRRDAEEIRESFSGAAAELLSRPIITGSMKWLFSNKAAKELTLQTEADLEDLLSGPLFARAIRFAALEEDAFLTPGDGAVADFGTHAASYYALLERLGGSHIAKELVYESIPEQLAASVDELNLDLSGFHGDLRLYQTFGTKYILHQKRVLLGDEMGLGKTVQAIAAMAHLHRENPHAHFLVVCPASVLVNWCREIKTFSDIPSFLLHGALMNANLEDWVAHGGIGVTNYESMEKVSRCVDNRMRLALLVIDEAHYIKNPEARRTQLICKIEDEAERLLLMTGTPLENRVEEMCALVRFLDPKLADKVSEMASLSKVPEFRELLAPVYLRRTREQVLTELPPIEEEDQWCRMTQEDADAYRAALREGSFPQVRRVSFLQEDLYHSAKAVRLLQLCEQAGEEGRRIVVYSYFRETIDKVESLLGRTCVGVLTGETPAEKRQLIIDDFSNSPEGSVLLCQVQAGGTGLNIQAASIVIFCEPQIKPSLEKQALSRVYRMGQVRNVLVYRLLCEGTVDEAMVQRLSEKQAEFDSYADESAMARLEESLIGGDWIRDFLESERKKFLPMVI